MKNIYDISIIIPHYNSPNTLGRLLNSIGDYSDTQVLVIDDKSNKEISLLKQCIDKYENSNTIFITNKTSQKGAGVCRNIGIEHAKGTWLIFADADDYFVENWHDVVKKYINSDNDIIYFYPLGNDCGTTPERIILVQELIANYLMHASGCENKLRYAFNPPWSKMIRRDVVSKNNIEFDKTRYANDALFSVKCGYYANNIKVTEESIYCLDEVPGSLTKQITFESMYIRDGVTCNIYKFLKERISIEDLCDLYIINVPLKNIVTSIRKKYGINNTFKLIERYKEYDFPIFKNIIYKNIVLRVNRKRTMKSC